MTPDTAVDVALARAVLYQAFADGLSPRGAEANGALESPGGLAVLTDAARLLGDRDVAAALASFPPCIPSASRVAELGHLFGHTARGAVPPYETEYGEEELFRQGYEMADLAGFYRAFGLEAAPERHERPDHASCECEFLALLCLKEAYALETGNEEMRAATASARRLFLRDHLGRFARAFGLRLSRAEGLFYPALGRALERFVDAECAREGVAAGPDVLALRPAELPTVPQACGTCPSAGGDSS